MRPEPPGAADLSRAQYSGWACCWCGKGLLDEKGVVSAGIARGRQGAVVLDIEVYACAACAVAPEPSNARG
ncbi:hypothetical protein [Streptomyces sp. NPDC088794]|uniref:hypothetical protein n=1 Tax=Streptomyces sp. NPDC088794 TaxID=3365902 RepID=UPI0038254C88